MAMSTSATDQSNWDAAKVAREVVRCGRRAALATRDRASGFPYASLVSLATSASGAPLLLLSNLARHTQNIEADNKVSLLVERLGEGDPLAAPRVTLIGTIAPDPDTENRRRFLARQPSARSYAGFPDFRIFRLEPESAHLVAGFGRIETLPREAVIGPIDDAATLLEAEEGAVEHMNADHSDAIALYAETLLGAPQGSSWQIDGLDPEGCELSSGSDVRYLCFPQRITNSSDLRKTLAELARKARAIIDERRSA
ncbi:HugZ family pyridoxamine 5'-phosphate oxidase [Terrihabitans sp. B22-R8]|uniref:HugZ family pyridoxamine 5'-phosphate oxidase n=1 Tax=Terrihabitans sp. B22-R8 TaxID=3425128 RepID=UPI00403C9990